MELLERTTQPEFSQTAPNTTTLYRPFEELFHFTINFSISALNLYVARHFHSFRYFALETNHFFLLQVHVISKRANRFDVENNTF